MANQERYLYAISAEGNCGWGDRNKNYLFSPIALVMQEAPCKEWYNLLLVPWVHYIPVDYHFNSLEAALRWADAHPRQVQTIVRNANDFAHAYLSVRNIKRFTELLLKGYAKRLAYTVKLRPEAEPAEVRGWWIFVAWLARWLVGWLAGRLHARLHARPAGWPAQLLVLKCGVRVLSW